MIERQLLNGDRTIYCDPADDDRRPPQGTSIFWNQRGVWDTVVPVATDETDLTFYISDRYAELHAYSAITGHRHRIPGLGDSNGLGRVLGFEREELKRRK